jgi:hypothetical protein
VLHASKDKKATAASPEREKAVLIVKAGGARFTSPIDIE